MSKKKLGKGLGEILFEVGEAYEREVPQKELVEIDLELIKPNPFQPRKKFDKESLLELANSIKKHGLLQPIVVIEDIDGYILVAGERRVRASKIAGLNKIKAIIAQIDKEKFRELALIENIQREELNPIELAKCYKELIEEYGITHEGLSEIVNKSRSHITNTLRLLELSSFTKKALQNGKISFGHAKVLVGLKEEEYLTKEIITKKLSVRETEERVKQLKQKPTKSRLNFSIVKRKLENIPLKYKISNNKIIFEFKDNEEISYFLKIFFRENEII
jgi:ParB family chromosome partitioning protein